MGPVSDAPDTPNAPDTSDARDAPDAPDVIEELTADHRAVQRLFDRIRAAAPGSAARKALVEQVSAALVRHFVVEKAYLYPAVRDYVADGRRWAEKELSDHGHIEELLHELEQRESQDEDFTALVLALSTRVTGHLLDEEQRLFPRLQATCPAHTRRELGEKVRRARNGAPTHPRPHAPDSALATRAVSPGLGLLDGVRDFLTRRGRTRRS
ncbi:hemerythrin domain-containing protein [Streptomyces bugieae]|uniref:Hemerythrin domain-containing protein n=1 Tax=Streptomyces bugieae TaxID=3098223 RepID=A0ABU7NKD2_9ACTN|nr:hemerythrin domain-containing protein [Streptomyces sp. DSM 41528]